MHRIGRSYGLCRFRQFFKQPSAAIEFRTLSLEISLLSLSVDAPYSLCTSRNNFLKKKIRDKIHNSLHGFHDFQFYCPRLIYPKISFTSSPPFTHSDRIPKIYWQFIVRSIVVISNCGYTSYHDLYHIYNANDKKKLFFTWYIYRIWNIRTSPILPTTEFASFDNLHLIYMYPTSFISFLIHQNYLAEYITCNKMCSFFK